MSTEEEYLANLKATLKLNNISIGNNKICIGVLNSTIRLDELLATEYLVKSGVVPTPGHLMRGVETEDLELLRILLSGSKKKINLHAPPNIAKKRTVLHHLVGWNMDKKTKLKIIRMLTQAGANWRTKDSGGETPKEILRREDPGCFLELEKEILD